MGRNDTRGDDLAKVPELRWLRVLVTLLAGTMALGVIAIAAILWLRLSEPPLPALPANLALPAGTAPAAVTFARDWTVVAGCMSIARCLSWCCAATRIRPSAWPVALHRSVPPASSGRPPAAKKRTPPRSR